LLASATHIVEEVLEGWVVILLPDADGRVQPRGGNPTILGPGEHDRSVAQWVYDRGEPAGLGTQTLTGALSLFLPLNGARGDVGALGIRPSNGRRCASRERYQLLEGLANQTALAIERAQLDEEAERTRVQVEAERLRNTLLSSVSHDLRTPIAAILGLASSLL